MSGCTNPNPHKQPMTLTLYAASSSQVPAVYAEAAATLGRLAASQGHTLVTGAGRTGLMGAAADAALSRGGTVRGIIPRFMVDEGWHHTGLTHLEIVPDMHTRKRRMAQTADAIIALPGGVGTLEELLELITWKQLGLERKPLVVLNTGGYFDPLFQLLDRAVAEHFMRPEHRGIWRVAATPAEALRLCRETPLWDDSAGKYAAL